MNKEKKESFDDFIARWEHRINETDFLQEFYDETKEDKQ